LSTISLTKRAEAVGIQLAKKGIKNAPTMRVGMAIDISGSMSGLYRSGTLQNAFDQMMGVAVKFDDNGELDVFQFNHNCAYVGTSNPSNYEDYIRKNIRIDGGTNYEPIAREVEKFFFEEKKSGGGFLGFGKKTVTVDDSPVLMLVLTDGEPGDAQRTLAKLNAMQNRNIYWHFVGIGGDRRSFPTIAMLADELPNVGEVYLPRLDMKDEEIYEQLICDELVEWVGKFTQNQQATA
jgi:hypothetical protein